MKRVIVVLVAVAAAAAAVPIAAAADKPAPPAAADKPAPPPVEFKTALLRVEINATDGDAGLQVDLDHEPWESIAISRPDGSEILDVSTSGVLAEFGLTELFSESSEPPFTKFPLKKFKKLFPAGKYTFVGETIDGVRMRSSVTLTHKFPAAPEITSPRDGSTVPRGALTVRWKPAKQPAGITIVGYRVLVTGVGEFSAELPAGATSIGVPVNFLQAGEYKVEVQAIEKSGNQTLHEHTFTVA